MQQGRMQREQVRQGQTWRNRLRVKTGLEALLEEGASWLKNKRVGLITNPTGVGPDLISTIDILRSRPDFKLVTLFGPEHGVRGDAQAGETVENATDSRTGLPMYSLYGKTKKPAPEMLDGLDVLVYELQDIGVRFYTNIYTLAYSIQAAGEAGIPFVVLDRPAPLGGVAIEGNRLKEGFSSFVGDYALPVRYGLTCGELANYLNNRFSFGADLRVARMKGWERGMWFDATGLPWVAPSPNMPTLETATAYPGTCLFEGTNLSEGRGTTLPFQIIGAPWVDGVRLAERMNGLDLPGVRFRPVWFVPTFSKHAGQRCSGVQVHVMDREVYPALRVGLELLSAVYRLHPDEFKWLPPHEGSQHHFFDLLMGTDEVRLGLDVGAPVADLTRSWEKEAAEFAAEVAPYQLY